MFELTSVLSRTEARHAGQVASGRYVLTYLDDETLSPNPCGALARLAIFSIFPVPERFSKSTPAWASLKFLSL